MALNVDAASVAARQSGSRTRMAESQETFLSLLTTQLKNQDPLSPMDANAFTQQVVQMTGVEQQLLTNDLLTALVGLSDGGLSNSVGLIGKTVTSEAEAGVLTETGIDWTYDLGRSAGSLKLEVVDQFGKTIATAQPGDLAAGIKSFKWDGKASDGAAQPTGGKYTLKVTAADINGSTISSTSLARVEGVATAVNTVNGETMVTVNGLQTPMSSIIGVKA